LMSHFAKKMGPWSGKVVAIAAMRQGRTFPSWCIAAIYACLHVAALMLGRQIPPMQSQNERSKIAWKQWLLCSTAANEEIFRLGHGQALMSSML